MKNAKIFVTLLTVLSLAVLLVSCAGTQKETAKPLVVPEEKQINLDRASAVPSPIASVTGLEIAETWTFVYLGEKPSKPSQSYAGKLCYMGNNRVERQIVGYNGANEDGVQQFMKDYVMNLKPLASPTRLYDDMGTYRLFGGSGVKTSSVTVPRPSQQVAAAEESFRITGFDTGKAWLNQEMKKDLETAAITLKKKDFKAISVKGYADIRGATGENASLSENRAKAAAKYLTSIKSLALQVTTKGMGQTAQFGEYAENRCVVLAGSQ